MLLHIHRAMQRVIDRHPKHASTSGCWPKCPPAPSPRGDQLPHRHRGGKLEGDRPDPPGLIEQGCVNPSFPEDRSAGNFFTQDWFDARFFAVASRYHRRRHICALSGDFGDDSVSQFGGLPTPPWVPPAGAAATGATRSLRQGATRREIEKKAATS